MNSISKYNPMSKEFQEEAKKLGLNGNQLIQKYIRERKMVNPSLIQYKKRKKFLEDNGFKNGSEYLEHLAKLRGFKNRNEQRRKIYEDDLDNNRSKNKEWHYNNGASPMTENENCASFVGVFLGENIIGKQILSEIFGNIQEEMSYGHKGFEYIVKGNYNIELKTGKFLSNRWCFKLGFNKIADYILAIGLDTEKTEILHVWKFKMGDIIKKRFGEKYREFIIGNLDSFCIGGNLERLLELKEFEITGTLKCIKNINENLKEIIT